MRDADANFMDMYDGDGNEPDEDDPSHVEGMLNTISGELSFRGMQVCWCLFSLDILLIEMIAEEIHCCPRTINTEIALIKIAFNCNYMDLNKKSFFDRYPDYIFTDKKKVKVIEKE